MESGERKHQKGAPPLSAAVVPARSLSAAMAAMAITIVREGVQENTKQSRDGVQKLRAALGNLLIPGKAIKNGDCFFDSVVQALSMITDATEQTVKLLRMLCHKYVNDSRNDDFRNWFQKDSDDQCTYADYRERVQYTFEDLKKEQKEATIIWADVLRDGKIIAQALQISIHVVRVENDGSVSHALIKQDDIANLGKTELNYRRKNTIYLAVYKKHVVPLLSERLYKKFYTQADSFSYGSDSAAAAASASGLSVPTVLAGRKYSERTHLLAAGGATAGGVARQPVQQEAVEDKNGDNKLKSNFQLNLFKKSEPLYVKDPAGISTTQRIVSVGDEPLDSDEELVASYIGRGDYLGAAKIIVDGLYDDNGQAIKMNAQDRMLKTANAGLYYRMAKEYWVALALIDDALQLVGAVTFGSNNARDEFLSTLYLEMGRCHKGVGNFQKSKECYLKSIKKCKGNFLTLNSLGVFFEESDPGLAENYYKRAIAANPGYSSAYNGLGNIVAKSGDIAGAIDLYSKAIELQPENGLYYSNRAIEKQKDKLLLDEAEQDYLMSVKLAPENDKFHAAFGDYYLTVKAEYSLARKHYDLAIAINPLNYHVLNNLFYLYMQIKDYALAGKQLIVLEQINNRDRLATATNRVSYSIEIGDYIAALDTLDRIINSDFINLSLYPKSSKLYHYRYVYSCIGTIMCVFCFYDEAFQAYTKALEFCQEDGEKSFIYTCMGNAAFDNKKFDDAIVAYLSAYDLGETDHLVKLIAEARRAAQVSSAAAEAAGGGASKKALDSLSGDRRLCLDNAMRFQAQTASGYGANITKSESGYYLASVIDDEFSGDRKKVFRLFKKDDGKWYKSYFQNPYKKKEELASDNKVIDFIVILENDEHKILGGNIGHFNLANNREVLFAGCICFKEGNIGLWSNCSGHYKPHHYLADNIATKTGLPIAHFRPMHYMKSRLDSLFVACNRNLERMTREMSGLVFGDKTIVQSLAHACGLKRV